jgi:hypothetical protein
MFYSNMAQATNRFLFLDWPNETAQISLYLSAAEQNFTSPHVEMYKAIDNISGQMIAHLILTRKLPREADATLEASSEAHCIPVGLNVEFQTNLRRTLAGLQKDMAEIDHLGKFIFSQLCSTSSMSLIK